jgi:hypothetical protein
MSGRDGNTRAPHTAKDRALAISELNDDLRRGTGSGRVAVTAGILALGRQALPAIMKLVQQFDDFGADNDPYGEHDFGAFEWSGHRIFWKIDYYDRQMVAGSPDAADPSVTTRVLTILLAEEY